MKKTIILLFIINTLCGYSQSHKLEGCWFLSNSEDFDFEVRYEQNKCQMIAYAKGTDSKLSDNYFYYEVINDTINYLNYSEKYDTIDFSYTIEELTESELHIRDIPDNKRYTYKRVCDSPPEINKFKVHEFLFTGNALAYISDSEPADYIETGLKMGSININDSFNSVSGQLGKVYKSLEGQNGVTNHIFLLDTINENINYIVLAERNDTLQAIQLTGYYTNMDYSFSSVRLGDYSNYVEQKLGTGSRQVEVKEINGYRWIYEPFPFSIEFVNDQVYSIRISR